MDGAKIAEGIHLLLPSTAICTEVKHHLVNKTQAKLRVGVCLMEKNIEYVTFLIASFKIGRDILNSTPKTCSSRSIT